MADDDNPSRRDLLKMLGVGGLAYLSTGSVSAQSNTSFRGIERLFISNLLSLVLESLYVVVLTLSGGNYHSLHIKLVF